MKLALIVRPSHMLDGPARSSLRAALDPAVELLAATRLPPRLTLVPFRRTPIVLAYVDDEAALAEARPALAALGPVSGYRLETHVPVPAKAPASATLLTLFRKKPGLDAATFRKRWYTEHTPLTLEVHPVVRYVRSAVDEVMFGQEAWDGIVTEDFAHDDDLFTLRLFGRGLTALKNAARVGLHVNTFLDLRTIETYLVERL